MTYNKDRDRAASVTEPIPVQRRRWGLSRGHAFLVVGFLAVYNVALILVDWLWACYPTDNDLDEVGWLVEHLSLSRPESLVNQGYPPGLPLEDLPNS